MRKYPGNSRVLHRLRVDDRVWTRARNQHHRLLSSCVDDLPDGGREFSHSRPARFCFVIVWKQKSVRWPFSIPARYFHDVFALADFLPLRTRTWTHRVKLFDRKRWGRRIGIGVAVASVVVLLLVILETDYYPRTDDASVRANFIEIAPEVSGRLVDLPVKDNMLVKKGTLLFVIDPRPYEYALQQALADQAILEEQIIDERRRIAAQHNAEDAARAGASHLYNRDQDSLQQH